MIWALLAFLGVPIWLIVGALLSAFWRRRRFRAQDGVFMMAVRQAGAEKWPRAVAFGRCFERVLVVNKGLALLGTSIYTIDGVSEARIDQLPRKPVDSVSRTIRCGDGTALEVAVAVDDAPRLDALAPVS
jgi:hypothetical protein